MPPIAQRVNASGKPSRKTHAVHVKGGAPHRLDHTVPRLCLRLPHCVAKCVHSRLMQARTLVNAFCWLAIASSVLTALLKFAFYAGADSQMLALVTGAFRVFIVLVVKYLAQILIDLPDIALYRCVQETRDRGGSIEA